MMRRVVIESPYGSRENGERCTPEEISRNIVYARECLRDCLQRGEAPFASHLLYTQVLDDFSPEARTTGMWAGFAWGRIAHTCVVYGDLGITPGMRAGIDHARAHGVPVEYRSLCEGVPWLAFD